MSPSVSIVAAMHSPLVCSGRRGSRESSLGLSQRGGHTGRGNVVVHLVCQTRGRLRLATMLRSRPGTLLRAQELERVGAHAVRLRARGRRSRELVGVSCELEVQRRLGLLIFEFGVSRRHRSPRASATRQQRIGEGDKHSAPGTTPSPRTRGTSPGTQHQSRCRRPSRPEAGGVARPPRAETRCRAASRWYARKSWLLRHHSPNSPKLHPSPAATPKHSSTLWTTFL